MVEGTLPPGVKIWWVDMTYERLADAGLNYFPCRYGKSRLMFRGPKCRLDAPYVAVIGGTETYGKFCPAPYPDVLEDHIGMSVVNFGAVNAGIDVFKDDATILDICSGARAVVLQIMGAHNLSNRFYSVHPRRNDRFLMAAPALRELYQDIDFTDFNFTRHLVQSLSDADVDKFARVKQELQTAWVWRMRGLIGAIAAPVILLWMAPRSPAASDDLFVASDPLFIDDMLLQRVQGGTVKTISVRSDEAAVKPTKEGLIFSEIEAAAAAEVPNAVAHRIAAEALAEGLQQINL